MDPLTIGMLAAAAGSAAYKMYKSSQDKPSPGPSGPSAMDRLNELRAGKAPGALSASAQNVAAATKPIAPAPAPTQYQAPATANFPVSPGSQTTPQDPLERLRRLQGGGF